MFSPGCIVLMRLYPRLRCAAIAAAAAAAPTLVLADTETEKSESSAKHLNVLNKQ